MIPGRHEWTSHAAPCDYAVMARETAKVVEDLEAGIKRAKAAPVRGMQEIMARNAMVMTLEDELMEQRSLYDLFCRKAEERRQV